MRGGFCWSDDPAWLPGESRQDLIELARDGSAALETGKTRMLDVLVVNAASTIMLLLAIEAMYPGKRLIHVLE